MHHLYRSSIKNSAWCALIVGSLLVIGCNNDSESAPEIILPELSLEMVNTSTTQSTAVIGVESSGISNNISLNIFFDTNSNFESPIIRSIELSSDVPPTSQIIRQRVYDLEPGQSYFVRTGAAFDTLTSYSNTVEIQTSQVNTFNPFELNDPTQETIQLHPELSFSLQGKGYTFRWDRSDASLYLAVYDPNKDTWENQLITNNDFSSTYFSQTGVISFSAANRIFFAFGGSRKVYEYLPESNTIQRLSDYPGTSSFKHKAVAYNDRIFIFGVTNTSASEDSVSVVEYDYVNDIWINKVSLLGEKRALFLPSIDGSKIYLVADEFGSGFLRSPSLLEYDVSNNTLIQRDATLSFPENEAAVINSFNLNGRTYYISNIYSSNNIVGSQHVSVFDPSDSSIKQLGSLVNTDSEFAKQIDASFVLDNTLFMETGSGEFYLFELL